MRLKKLWLLLTAALLAVALTAPVFGRGSEEYRNPELDRLVRVAQNEQDVQARMDAFGEIQRILIDDAVILPNYERGVTYVTNPQLKGMVRRAVGPDPDFSNAWIEE